MATYKEFLVSGDCHIIEPPDLFKTRLPANMRDRALWEEEFTLEEPIVPGGHTEFRKLHTIGFDGWTVSKYRQFEGHDGTTPGWIPDDIIADMDMEGVDAAVFFPNLALFVLFTDDHELSMAHARAWNDWVAETYLQYKDRMRPVAAIPLTNIPDAVAEIERVGQARPAGADAAGDPPGAVLVARRTSRSGTAPRRSACRSSSTSPPAG